MATKGQQIYNKVTTDKITFLQTRQDTDGTLLQFENKQAAGGIGPMPHRHPLQEEIFIVKKGTLEITIAGVTSTIKPGETATVPPNTVHFWKNAGGNELEMITEFRPALHFEELIETLASLSQIGKVDKGGNPDRLQMSATLNAYYGEFFLATMPFPIQVFLFKRFGWLLRKFFGFKGFLPYKSEIN